MYNFKKFWEEWSHYFLWWDTDRIEKKRIRGGHTKSLFSDNERRDIQTDTDGHTDTQTVELSNKPPFIFKNNISRQKWRRFLILQILSQFVMGDMQCVPYCVMKQYKGRRWGVRTMVYDTRNYLVFLLFHPRYYKKHQRTNYSETESVPSSGEERDTYSTSSNWG
jgi:hypothetical protein